MGDVNASKSSKAAAAYPFVSPSAGNHLPSAWNHKDKGPYVGLSKNFLRAHYKGPAKSTKDASAVRANNPIPFACGMYYYEVKICSKTKDGTLSIGFGTDTASVEKLPGWEESSYGYHCDDGQAYHTNNFKDNYGHKVVAGDVVGCGLDFIEKLVFYTVNGSSCGPAYTDLKFKKDAKIFPMLGLSSPSDAAEANFGERDFVFDVSKMQEDRKKQFCAGCFTHPLGDDFPKAVNGAQSMVLSYLVTHGYLDAARKLADATGRRLVENVDFDKNRCEIVQLILRGEISSAVAAIEDSYPDVLVRNKELLFRLHCQQFVEMVKQVDDGRARILVAAHRPAPTSGSRSTSGSAAASPGSSTSGASNGRHLSSASRSAPKTAAEKLAAKAAAAASSNGHSSGGENESMDIDVDGLSDSDQAAVELPMDGVVEESRSSKMPTPVSCEGPPSSSGPGVSRTSECEDRVSPSPGPAKCSESSMSGEDECMHRVLEFGVGLQQEFDKLQVVRDRVEDRRLATSTLKELVTDSFSLIAYEDLGKSPKQHLLRQSYRDDLSLEVNSAILESQKQLPVSTLEVMVRHMRYSLQLNAEKGNMPVFPLAVEDFCKYRMPGF